MRRSRSHGDAPRPAGAAPCRRAPGSPAHAPTVARGARCPCTADTPTAVLRPTVPPAPSRTDRQAPGAPTRCRGTFSAPPAFRYMDRREHLRVSPALRGTSGQASKARRPKGVHAHESNTGRERVCGPLAGGAGGGRSRRRGVRADPAIFALRNASSSTPWNESQFARPDGAGGCSGCGRWGGRLAAIRGNPREDSLDRGCLPRLDNNGGEAGGRPEGRAV